MLAGRRGRAPTARWTPRPGTGRLVAVPSLGEALDVILRLKGPGGVPVRSLERPGQGKGVALAFRNLQAFKDPLASLAQLGPGVLSCRCSELADDAGVAWIKGVLFKGTAAVRVVMKLIDIAI